MCDKGEGLLQYKAKDEVTPSQLATKKEDEEKEEVFEVLDFEVFNQTQSPEAPTSYFSHLPSAQVSQTQGDSFILKAMGLQRKPKLATLPSTQVSQTDLVDNKRKRDQEGKEVMEERKNLPLKEVEAQRGGKQARVMQTRSSNEGAIIDRRGDQQTEVLAWAPSLVRDKALLPSDTSIRAYTTLLPSVHQALPTPRPTLPPR